MSAPTLPAPVSRRGLERLAALESIIDAGLNSFLDTGNALIEIRDGKLYLEHAETFEAYCTERWGLSRARSYELIDAAEITSALSGMPDTPTPANPRQANALRPLKGKPESAAEAMRKANEVTGGKPTAKAITDAVKDELAKQNAKAAKKQKDKAELDKLKEQHTPAGFDPKAEKKRLEERGNWSGHCREIAKLRDASTFVEDHRADFTKRHIEQAERAYAWLDLFLLTYREAE